MPGETVVPNVGNIPVELATGASPAVMNVLES